MMVDGSSARVSWKMKSAVWTSAHQPVCSSSSMYSLWSLGGSALIGTSNEQLATIVVSSSRIIHSRIATPEQTERQNEEDSQTGDHPAQR